MSSTSVRLVAPGASRVQVNAAITDAWAAKPMADLREAFASQPGELRGYLTVVPEARWLKDAARLKSFYDETIDHYHDHLADLQAILEAAGPDA